MNRRLLVLAAAFALTAAELFTPTKASADSAVGVVRVRNDSAWTIDCGLVLGNGQVPFKGIAPGTTSSDAPVPLSNVTRTVVCKKSESTIAADRSAALRFTTPNPLAYTVACVNKPDGTGLVCSVSTSTVSPQSPWSPGKRRALDH